MNMEKFKDQIKKLMFYFPFAFSALIVYFATDPSRGDRLPAIMLFLPICFFWIGESLRQSSNESSKLRDEIVELKKKIDELKIVA
jgi:hypothetical protein